MSYFLAAVIAAGLVYWWLTRIVKKAVVQPVRLDNGILLDARLTEKTRWQVWWDDNKFYAGFAAGLMLATVALWVAY